MLYHRIFTFVVYSLQSSSQTNKSHVICKNDVKTTSQLQIGALRVFPAYNMDRVQLGAVGQAAQNIDKKHENTHVNCDSELKCMKLHILSNKMHKNVMYTKLLDYALEVVRLDRP